MEIGFRIKQIRLDKQMTLDQFGAHIGIKKAGLSAIELGRNNVREQVINRICEEFNVSEQWLLAGEGEMYCSYQNDDLIGLRDKYKLANIDMILIDKFLNMNADQRIVITNFILDVSSAYNRKKEGDS